MVAINVLIHMKSHVTPEFPQLQIVVIKQLLYQYLQHLLQYLRNLNIQLMINYFKYVISIGRTRNMHY